MHQFSNGQNADIFKRSKRKILKPSKPKNSKTVKIQKNVNGQNAQMLNRLKRKQG